MGWCFLEKRLYPFLRGGTRVLCCDSCAGEHQQLPRGLKQRGASFWFSWAGSHHTYSLLPHLGLLAKPSYSYNEANGVQLQTLALLILGLQLPQISWHLKICDVIKRSFPLLNLGQHVLTAS